MKFEIDDKTGMIKDETTLDFIPTETTSGDNPVSHHPVTSHQLEQILQAVKKTQEKLLNKQIQEIQDSKKFVFNPPKDMPECDRIHLQKMIDEMPTKSKIVLVSDPQKIEQNQKIVDALIKEHHDAPTTEGMHYGNILNNFVRRATGKDITELS